MTLFGIRNEFELYSGNISKLVKEERKKKVNKYILEIIKYKILL